MIPSIPRGSKIIIALTKNNHCTNFNRRFCFKNGLVSGFFLFGQVTAKYVMVFVFPF